jgi:hypothetical protein
MSPSELKKLTLKQLRAIRTASFELRWTLALEAASAAERTEAALLLVSVNHAIIALENAELAKIRDELIDGIAAFVGIAARIAKLAV